MREEELDSRVEDYWQLGQGWKWSALSCYLQPTLLLQLASTTLENGDLVEEQVAWLSPNNTTFTVSFAYKLLTGVSEEDR